MCSYHIRSCVLTELREGHVTSPNPRSHSNATCGPTIRLCNGIYWVTWAQLCGSFPFLWSSVPLFSGTLGSAYNVSVFSSFSGTPRVIKCFFVSLFTLDTHIVQCAAHLSIFYSCGDNFHGSAMIINTLARAKVGIQAYSFAYFRLLFQWIIFSIKGCREATGQVKHMVGEQIITWINEFPVIVHLLSTGNVM